MGGELATEAFAGPAGLAIICENYNGFYCRDLQLTCRTCNFNVLFYEAVFTFRSISWVLSNRGRPNSQWISPTCSLSYTLDTMPTDALATKEHGIACIVLKTYSASSIRVDHKQNVICQLH